MFRAAMEDEENNKAAEAEEWSASMSDDRNPKTKKRDRGQREQKEAQSKEKRPSTASKPFPTSSPSPFPEARALNPLVETCQPPSYVQVPQWLVNMVFQVPILRRTVMSLPFSVVQSGPQVFEVELSASNYLLGLEFQLNSTAPLQLCVHHHRLELACSACCFATSLRLLPGSMGVLEPGMYQAVVKTCPTTFASLTSFLAGLLSTKTAESPYQLTCSQASASPELLSKLSATYAALQAAQLQVGTLQTELKELTSKLFTTK